MIMLVRCELCGSALPQEASKCFKCGSKRTPQIYSRTEIEIPDSTLEQRKQKWGKVSWIIGTVALFLIIVGIILIIAGPIVIDNASGIDSQGHFYYDKNKPTQGLIMTLSGVGCLVVAGILTFIIIRYESSLRVKTRVVEENKIEKPDEVEYEQRIRDFISQ